MPVTTRDADLDYCATKLTEVFMTKCPVAAYSENSPGRYLVQRALYDLLDAGYIDAGTELFKGEPSRG